jgi:hypothetical protein
MSDWIKCCRCGEQFCLHPETEATLRRSASTFHCPWGHPQHFPLGKSAEQKLRDELDAERRRRQSAEQNVEFYSQMQKRAEASARGYKGVATKLKNRARAGVCPCCKRTFKQLAAHMANKHPEFSPNPDGDLPTDAPPILSVVEGGKA